MRTKARGTPLLWAMIAFHLAFVVVNTLFGLVTGAMVPVLTISLAVAIATIHGLKRYSLKEYLAFALITFVVSNAYENLSIMTGFPFGDYYYSDRLGLKLFLVPLVIAPAYFAACYFAWSIAHILLGLFDKRPRGSDIVLVPVIASLIGVMWDMVMDPANATIGKSWIWEDGGAYFGVPFSNYLGWLLCLYTIFQLFALYLARSGPATSSAIETGAIDRSYWYQAIVPFFTLSVSWVLRSFTAEDAIVADPAGQQWHTMHIYESMFLVAIFTMWFVCLLSTMLVSRNESGRAA